MEVANLDLHFLSELLVERRQGLVHEQDARLEDDGAGERDALALTARELVDVAGTELAELDELEHLLHAIGDFRLADPAQPQGIADVAGDRHVREEGIVLEHHADVALVGR
jgi:hypothetical protein